MRDLVLFIFPGKNICREARCDLELDRLDQCFWISFDVDSDEDCSRICFGFLSSSLEWNGKKSKHRKGYFN